MIAESRTEEKDTMVKVIGCIEQLIDRDIVAWLNCFALHNAPYRFGKKIEQALFFALNFHYLCDKETNRETLNGKLSGIST